MRELLQSTKIWRKEFRNQICPYKYTNNHIESTYFLSQISMKYPRLSLRLQTSFEVRHSGTNYSKNNLIVRDCIKFNNQFQEMIVLVFDNEPFMFKSAIRKLLST